MHCEFTREDWQAIIKQEIYSRTGEQPDRDWITKTWNHLEETWQSRLGSTLRQEVCLPDLQGEELQTAYRTSWETRLSGFPFPEELTPEACDSQRVDGVKITRFLSRYIRERFVEMACYSGDEINRFAEQYPGLIQDDARSNNGRYLVISANPLDLLTTSDWSAYRSCHRWIDDFREVAAGNFGYVQSDQTLVAYTHSRKSTRTTSSGHVVPTKIWRCMVFVDSAENPQAIWTARQYPAMMTEFHHSFLRDTLARLIWDGQPARSVKRNPPEGYHTYHGYSDSLQYTANGCTRIKLDSAEELAVIQIPRARCPLCNAERYDSQRGRIICSTCDDEEEEEDEPTVLCSCCGDHEPWNDGDDWGTTPAGQILCPGCTHSHTYSSCMEGMIPDADVVSFTNQRGHEDSATAGWLDENGYPECDVCGERHHNMTETDDHENVCPTCLEDYTQCGHCDAWHSR